MKLALITLGCPKNIVDSEQLKGALTGENVQFVEPDQDTDAIIINTCGFIQSAKEEAIEMIFEVIEAKKAGKTRHVLVTGCLATRYLDELKKEIPEVDGFYSNRDIAQAIQDISQQLHVSYHPIAARSLLTPAHYAYLKISEGCDNRCAYCAIPLIRGPLTSRPEAEIIAEARHLIKNGVRELIVIAQDTTNYGQDRGEPGAIVPLLRQLVKIEGLEWLRVMYSHPAHYSDEFIDLVASEDKICKYLDIPIQHISDSILSRMRRRITRSGIEALTKKVRDRIPGVALRTSLIVGFPGESDQEFQELLEYIAGAKFERLGAFVYSPEDGTPAYAWGDEIPLAVKQDRAEQVQMVQSDISQERNQKLVGTIQRVIVDEFDVDQGMFFGRTQWDAPEIDNVIWLKETDLEIGGFYQVKITEAFDFDLIGQVIRN